MGRSIAYSQVFEAMSQGVSLAQRKYEYVSGEWVWKAPEYFTTVKIFDKLAGVADKDKSGIKWVTLEERLSRAIECASSAGISPDKDLDEDIRKKLRINGKADLCVWDSRDQPRGIIEVKISDKSSNQAIAEDLERILTLLELSMQKGLSIKYGALVLYLSNSRSSQKTSKERLNARIKSLEEYIEDAVSDTYDYLFDYVLYGNQDDAWASIVLMIFSEN